MMFRRCIDWCVVGIAMCGPTTARAGLYDPAPPDAMLVSLRKGQDVPFEIFRDALVDAIRAADPAQSGRTPRKALLERRTVLLNRKLERLSPSQLNDLAVVQLRLRDLDGALEALKRAEGQNPRDFWTLTTLGTAYQTRGQSSEAARYLEAAQDFPPDPQWLESMGLTRPWLQTLERAQLMLLRLRMREGQGRPARGQRPAVNVDELFPVKFIGPSGQYEAGKFADAEKAKLPNDAVAVVQQLLLWAPEDTRLYWLLGELYNARGDLTSADAIFEECVWSRRYNAEPLREHRLIVKEAIKAQAPPPPPPPEDWKPSTAKLVIVGVVAGLALLALAYYQARELFRVVFRSRSSAPPPARG
jgi:tetratricopeptide (TPR) repeat protein